MLKFRTKLEDYLEKPNGIQRIRQEREKYITRLKQLKVISFYGKTTSDSLPVQEMLKQ